MQRSLFSSYVLSNNKTIFHPSTGDLVDDSDETDGDEDVDIFSRATTGQPLSEPIPTISAKVAAAEMHGLVFFSLIRTHCGSVVSVGECVLKNNGPSETQ